jgi:hypothetical protein
MLGSGMKRKGANDDGRGPGLPSGEKQVPGNAAEQPLARDTTDQAEIAAGIAGRQLMRTRSRMVLAGKLNGRGRGSVTARQHHGWRNAGHGDKQGKRERANTDPYQRCPPSSSSSRT